MERFGNVMLGGGVRWDATLRVRTVLLGNVVLSLILCLMESTHVNNTRLSLCPYGGSIQLGEDQTQTLISWAGLGEGLFYGKPEVPVA